MTKRLQLEIAGQSVEIYSDITDKIAKRLPGFGSFLGTANNSVPLLQFIIEPDNGDRQELLIEGEDTLIHTFSLEKDSCRLSRQGDKYIFTIEESEGFTPHHLFMEIGSPVVRSNFYPKPDHLKFSLWIALGFTGIPMKLAAIHSSVIVVNNRAIMFLGESGCGKSTHTKLWLKHIPGSTLLNDDSPVLRIEDNKPFVYGSPWSGKGRCYLNERYPIEAIVRLKQHPNNKIDRLNKLESFGALYPSFPPAFLKDEYFEGHICAMISAVITTTPVYLLHCLPNQEAAEMVWGKTFGQKRDSYEKEDSKY